MRGVGREVVGNGKEVSDAIVRQLAVGSPLRGGRSEKLYRNAKIMLRTSGTLRGGAGVRRGRGARDRQRRQRRALGRVVCDRADLDVRIEGFDRAEVAGRRIEAIRNAECRFEHVRLHRKVGQQQRAQIDEHAFALRVQAGSRLLRRAENRVAERSVDCAMERVLSAARKRVFFASSCTVFASLWKLDRHLAAHLRRVEPALAEAGLAGQRDHVGLVELFRAKFQVDLLVGAVNIEKPVEGLGVLDQLGERFVAGGGSGFFAPPPASGSGCRRLA